VSSLIASCLYCMSLVRVLVQIIAKKLFQIYQLEEKLKNTLGRCPKPHSGTLVQKHSVLLREEVFSQVFYKKLVRCGRIAHGLYLFLQSFKSISICLQIILDFMAKIYYNKILLLHNKVISTPHKDNTEKAMAYTFIGGKKMRPFHSKLPWRDIDNAFIHPAPPKRVYISMEQHAMDRCEPVVTLGQYVRIGDIIGVPERADACNIYASVSGTIADVFPHTSMTGATVDCVAIENDEANEYSPSLSPQLDSLLAMDRNQIIQAIKLAAVTDFDTKPTPLHRKLKAAIGQADRFIVRCFDSDVSTSVNASIAIEDPEAVIGGIKILLRALSIHRAIVVTWADEKDVIFNLSEVPYPSEMIMPVKVVKKYPQYDSRILVSALINKEVLRAGKTVSNCLILDAQTIAAVYYALVHGTPHTNRHITISGECATRPENLLVPVGTPISHITENHLPANMRFDKIVNGNRFIGNTLSTDAIIDTNVHSLLFMWERNIKAATCTNCGKCARLCPAKISPKSIAFAAKRRKQNLCKRLGINHCLECELCSNICPSNISLFEYIKSGKHGKRYTITGYRHKNEPLFDPSEFAKEEKDITSELEELMQFTSKISLVDTGATEVFNSINLSHIQVPDESENTEEDSHE